MIALFHFCHPELVEGSASGKSGLINWRLILRQAQDDGAKKAEIVR
jgi:hypothetical protein